MILISYIIAVTGILVYCVVMYYAFAYSRERVYTEDDIYVKPVVPYETVSIFYNLLKEYASLDEIITIRKRRKQRVSDLYQKQQLVGTAVSKLYEEVNGIVNLNHKIITEHNSYYVVELLKKL